MKIDIQHKIERTDTGDIIAVWFDDIKYYIKLHITDDYLIALEIRKSHPDCDAEIVFHVDYEMFMKTVKGGMSLKKLIEEAETFVKYDVIEHLEKHYGVEV